MLLPPLLSGTIIKRYKRFLADIRLDDGTLITAHCPNTGSMESCWRRDAPVQVSHSDNPRRKLPWTLERIDMGNGWIGVHTGRTNALVEEGIKAGKIELLLGYNKLQREVNFTPPGHARTRLDFLLSDGQEANAYVEVKNATFFDGDRILFPDAVTERGRKHLDVLREAVINGNRGIILFAVNRSEGTVFSPAREKDPEYARRLQEVSQEGVEILVLRIAHQQQGMEVAERLPVQLQ